MNKIKVKKHTKNLIIPLKMARNLPNKFVVYFYEKNIYKQCKLFISMRKITYNPGLISGNIFSKKLP